jgi:hypothetical protein
MRKHGGSVLSEKEGDEEKKRLVSRARVLRKKSEEKTV